MDHLGDGCKRNQSPVQQTNNLSNSPYFDVASSTPSPQITTTPNQFYNPIGFTGIGYNPYTSPGYPTPLNFGFNVDPAANAEQFTAQELAELDEYLNSLSQGSAGPPSPAQFHSPQASSASSSASSPNDLFTQAASSGRTLYEEALNQWSVPFSAPPEAAEQTNSGTSVYSPFGSGAFTYGENNVNTSADIVSTSYVGESVDTSSKKPSFADVAKNKPSKSISKHCLHSHNSVPEKHEQSDQTHITKVNSAGKTKKSKLLKQGRRKNNIVPVKHKDIRPDSRYGLDTFEEASVEKKQSDRGGRECSGRKHSTSSVSSTMSGEDRNDSLQAEATPVSHAPTKQRIPSKVRHQNNSGPNADSFFDPRRIFGESHKTTAEPSNDFVPNNKQKIHPSKSKDTVKASVKGGSTKYINNDLRDMRKHNNVEQEHSTSKQTEGEPRRRVGSEQEGGRCKGKRSDVASSEAGAQARARRQHAAAQNARRLIGGWLQSAWQWLRCLLAQLWSFLWSIGTLVLSVFLLLMALLLHYTISWTLRLWSLVKQKLAWLRRHEEQFDWSEEGFPVSGRQKQCGLKEHIALPTTGDEAMRRLLLCKGKDPYSILGVRGDASDEDIKKYYRKQAFLVHPDKNKQPGAEEAFKILGHAFDLIGTPEKRKEYDSQLDREDAETAMQEFADLLSKLNDKMQEAANLLRCEHCGGKHKRVPTQRPMYCARFCQRCNTRHPAKEGDVWAESTMMGFLWHYYACMEGKVFDITEWAKCKRENFSQLQANAHQVIYRLTTTGGRAKHASRSGEADLEDFLTNLFQHASCSVPPDAATAAPGRPTPANTTASKKARKKKKKH